MCKRSEVVWERGAILYECVYSLGVRMQQHEQIEGTAIQAFPSSLALPPSSKAAVIYVKPTPYIFFFNLKDSTAQSLPNQSPPPPAHFPCSHSTPKARDWKTPNSQTHLNPDPALKKHQN
jgi:hypothetical protein